MKSLVILMAVAAMAFSMPPADDHETKFVQFVVEQDISPEEALEIDDFMKTQPGIQLSRMDSYSHKFLVTFNVHQPYNESYFVETFEQFGLTIKCYREGIKGVDRIIHQKMDCQ